MEKLSPSTKDIPLKSLTDHYNERIEHHLKMLYYYTDQLHETNLFNQASARIDFLRGQNSMLNGKKDTSATPGGDSDITHSDL